MQSLFVREADSVKWAGESSAAQSISTNARAYQNLDNLIFKGRDSDLQKQPEKNKFEMTEVQLPGDQQFFSTERVPDEHLAEVAAIDRNTVPDRFSDLHK